MNLRKNLDTTIPFCKYIMIITHSIISEKSTLETGNSLRL